MSRSVPRSHLVRRRHLAALVAALALVAAVLTLPTASAVFTSRTTNPANALAADRLQPPSGLTATTSCLSSTIVFRAATKAAGSGSLVLPTPPGTSAGDLLVAQVSNWGGPAVLTPPAGWTLIRRDSAFQTNGAAQVTSALFWRVAVATEPASATFQLAASVDMAGGIAAYSGVSTTSPVDTHEAATGTSATTTVPSVTTTVANTMLVHLTTKRQEQLPAPGGTAERWRQISGTGTSIQGVSAGDVSFAGPGATPVRSSTSPSTFSSEWIGQTLALRPIPQQPAATLNWTATPSSWATGYRGERIVGGTVQATNSAPMGTTTVTDPGLVNGTTYTYRIWAHRGTWVSTAVTTTLTPSC
jgi:hypothetical protein